MVLHQSILPKHRRGPWSQAEDQQLLQLVQTQGAHNWVRISHLIQTRSPKQCRERYHQNLKPSLNLDPISPQEGVLIERMVAEMGKRWAEIARRLNGRSDNAVKNWWNGGMNRRKRLDNRRAEMPPRQAQALYLQSEARTRAMEASCSRQSIPHPVAYQPEPCPPPPPQYRPAPNPTPALSLAPSNQLNHLRGAEPPLPSPAVSCISRAESSEGAPPSLISDHSYGSHSTSPRQSPKSNELPPVIETQAKFHQPMTPTLPTPVDHPAYSPQEMSWPKHAPRHSPRDLPPVQTDNQRVHQWKDSNNRSPTVTQVPFGGQLPLPSYYTITAPEPRSPPQPQSPPKDSRMDLKSLMD